VILPHRSIRPLNYTPTIAQNVTPVNPKTPEIAGVACVRALSDLPSPSEYAVSIVTPPAVTEKVRALQQRDTDDKRRNNCFLPQPMGTQVNNTHARVLERTLTRPFSQDNVSLAFSQMLQIQQARCLEFFM
jgi:hypothetical protein